MSYAMFSSAGDKLVDRILFQILNQLKELNNLPEDLESCKINQIINQVAKKVEEMGFSQVNPSKYDDNDQIEGFEEVFDYAVTDNIYVKITDFIIDYKRSKRKAN